MTTNDLDAITARADAANEGPWAIWHDLDYQGYKTVGDAESYATVLAGNVAEESNPAAHVYTVEDAEFIAHAREDVPDLVAEVRELRAWRDAVALGLGYAEEAGPFIQVANPQVIVDGILESILGGPDPTQLLGATDVGEPGTWPNTAGEFAARWNRHTLDEREQHVRGIVEAQLIAEQVRMQVTDDYLRRIGLDPSYDHLVAASSVDNATQVNDPTDDAGHDHRDLDESYCDRGICVREADHAAECDV